MKDEVIGRNCSLFMTENLGKHHDELIWRFLKRGKLQENLINRMKPLIARKKSGTFFKVFLSFNCIFWVAFVGATLLWFNIQIDLFFDLFLCFSKGFLVPMEMKLGVGYLGYEDVGINSLITVNRSANENYIVLDTQSKGFALRIDGFTENIFNRLFEPMCNFDLADEFL